MTNPIDITKKIIKPRLNNVALDNPEGRNNYALQLYKLNWYLAHISVIAEALDSSALDAENLATSMTLESDPAIRRNAKAISQCVNKCRTLAKNIQKVKRLSAEQTAFVLDHGDAINDMVRLLSYGADLSVENVMKHCSSFLDALAGLRANEANKPEEIAKWRREIEDKIRLAYIVRLADAKTQEEVDTLLEAAEGTGIDLQLDKLS